MLNSGAYAAGLDGSSLAKLASQAAAAAASVNSASTAASQASLPPAFAAWPSADSQPPTMDANQQAQYMWLLLYLQTQRFLQQGSR